MLITLQAIENRLSVDDVWANCALEIESTVGIRALRIPH